MNYKAKEEQLVKEFNKNRQIIARLQARQLQIQGQLQLIKELQVEGTLKKKDDIQHKIGKKHK